MDFILRERIVSFIVTQFHTKSYYYDIVLYQMAESKCFNCEYGISSMQRPTAQYMINLCQNDNSE